MGGSDLTRYDHKNAYVGRLTAFVPFEKTFFCAQNIMKEITHKHSTALNINFWLVTHVLSVKFHCFSNEEMLFSQEFIKTAKSNKKNCAKTSFNINTKGNSHIFIANIKASEHKLSIKVQEAVDNFIARCVTVGI